jgi:adenosylmethionine-8-amino-7-oxononanoate aminotransferase
MGKVLEMLLKKEIAPLPHVADIRGRGLYWAVEFMIDGEKRIPFAADSHFSDNVVDAAAELGLSILGNIGPTGDVNVEHVIISPPFIVKQVELEKIVELFKQAIMVVNSRT